MGLCGTKLPQDDMPDDDGGGKEGGGEAGIRDPDAAAAAATADNGGTGVGGIGLNFAGAPAEVKLSPHSPLTMAQIKSRTLQGSGAVTLPALGFTIRCVHAHRDNTLALTICRSRP